MRKPTSAFLAAPALLAIACAQFAAAQDPLPSWNDTRAKRDILAFVARVTKPGSPDFVPIPERIATFDNDGTLWSEQPIYFQFAFVFDRIKALAPQHPEWKQTQPFKGILEGDTKAALAGGEKSLVELLVATSANMTTAEFHDAVAQWIQTARHPRFKRPYTDLVFQPMLELLAYLRANGFKTYIVSGGTVEFMRVWTERVYGVPPEQVIGTSFKLDYELRNGVPVIMRLPRVDFIDDKAGKPVGIQKFIGRRPVFAAGNSDGDFEMLQWTTSGPSPRFALIMHHTDAIREWAYDRYSKIGTLAKALDAAPRNGWLVVDMKNDWRVIYPFEK